MNELDLTKEIILAAIILDKVYPDWPKLIDIKKLSMRSLEDCILGQLYPNQSFSDSIMFMRSHGFIGMYAFANREELWIEEINKRKQEKT